MSPDMEKEMRDDFIYWLEDEERGRLEDEEERERQEEEEWNARLARVSWALNQKVDMVEIAKGALGV